MHHASCILFQPPVCGFRAFKQLMELQETSKVKDMAKNEYGHRMQDHEAILIHFGPSYSNAVDHV